MSDEKLLPNVSARGSDPDVRDEVGVTCIRIAIIWFSCLGGDPRRLINLGNLTASPLGDSVGGPLRTLLEKADVEVGDAGGV